MSQSSDAKNRYCNRPKLRGRKITIWHIDNLIKMPYNVDKSLSVPLNFFWLNTGYINCQTNAKRLSVGGFFESNSFDYTNYPAEFKMKLTRLNDSDIQIEIHRILKDGTLPDDGYFLRFCLEICGSRHPGMYTDMPFHTNVVCVPFKIDDCPHDNDFKDETVIKCGAFMYEMANLEEYETFTSQNQTLLHNLEDTVENPEQAYSDLAFIMNHDNLNCISSGRQGDDFVEKEVTLLARTLKFSTVLAERLRCVIENVPFDNLTPIGLILGYIYSGFFREIHASECLKLYCMSFTYCMPFLKQESSLFLCSNFTEPGLIVDIILTANMVDDWKLVDVGIDFFIAFKTFVLASDRWKEILPHQAAIIRSLVMKKENFLIGRNTEN